MGQARAYIQLDKRDDALKCLLEVLRLTEAESARHGKSDGVPGGPYAEQIEELLNRVLARHLA
jgi:hypothetical protein